MKTAKMSPQRLDVVESICSFLQTDPKTPEIAPRTMTCEQLIAWQRACTNPAGFRQTSEKFSTHVNKDLPLDAQGNRKTVLRFPQWFREYKISRGHYNFAQILADYNASLAMTPAKTETK